VAEALPDQTEWQQAKGDDGIFVLQTFRSHDQYNTTIYGLDDRYRGIYGEREVVFMNRKDMDALGFEPSDRVDIIGDHDDAIDRIAKNFRVVPYDIPRGCVAGYYPELNILVPHQSFGDKSYTPASKSVPVRFRLTVSANQ
jgi:anaerobic selenocysteine-containing dehydrogenase